MLVLIGVAAAFRAAFLPHMTKSSVASKLAEANHPVACPPQWLPVLLAANIPVPTTNGHSPGQAAYVVTFPDRGTDYPKGTITLVQTAGTGDLVITTKLTGLEGATLGNKWHGALPFTHNAQAPHTHRACTALALHMTRSLD